MNFLVGFPHTRRQKYSIWVLVDRLTESAHFLPDKSTYSAEDYAWIYIDEIVSLHGIFYPTYRITMHNSHLDFGDRFTKGWVHE